MSAASSIFRSGPPWNLSCTIDRIGADYLCRIEGGDRHIGAVALAQWSARGARTQTLAVDGHREASIATQAAHRLCEVTRRTVTCIGGIHFDGVTRVQIEEIVETVQDLTREAARGIADRAREEIS